MDFNCFFKLENAALRSAARGLAEFDLSPCLCLTHIPVPLIPLMPRNIAIRRSIIVVEIKKTYFLAMDSYKGRILSLDLLANLCQPLRNKTVRIIKNRAHIGCDK